MKKSLLLTGGSGFIGSHLAERLIEENYELIILKRSFSSTWRINSLIEEKPENLVLFDIDKSKLEDVFNNYSVEGIFHLATAYINNPTHEEILTIVKSNIEFPTELLDLTVKNDIKYFINTGTFFEYSLDNLPLNEYSKICPQDFYSTSKVSFEEILKYYYNEYDFHASTLKLYTPYGPRDDETKIIPYLIINTLKQQEIKINNPQHRLDIVHVYDIVDAYIKLKDNILKFKDYETFNVAKDINYSLDEIFSYIKFNLNLEKEMKIDEKEIPMFSNPEKIKNTLNWEPKIDINKGIANTIDYYRNKYGCDMDG